MEVALRALLLPIAPRCYWGRAPQQPVPARPYVVLSRISGVRGYHMRGGDGVMQSRVQIDIYADSYAAAATLGAAIIGVLSGYRGGVFRGIFIDSERDFGLEASDPGELHRRSIDVMAHHDA